MFAIWVKTACSNLSARQLDKPADIAERHGFTMLVGGQGDADSRLGEPITDFLFKEEAVDLTGRLLGIMKENNCKASEVVRQIGIERLG
jgi:NAD(P)H-nitrite reductase large subunit